MKDCRGKGDIRSSIVLYASTSLTVDLTFFEICERRKKPRISAEDCNIYVNNTGIFVFSLSLTG
jgi:hypothetical protein